MSKQLAAVAVEAASFGFTPLSDRVYTFEPTVDNETAAAPEDPSHPRTVIIFGWGDARPKHVAKYVDGYRALFPRARQVLVFSPILPALYQSLEVRTQAMMPTIDAVFGAATAENAKRGSHDQRKDRGKILIHAMSNTGGIACAAAFNAYLERFSSLSSFSDSPSEQDTWEPLPHTLLVLDSTPGGIDWLPNIGRWSRAMAVGAGAWFPWPFAVTQAMAATFLTANHLLYFLSGWTSAPAYSVRGANRPDLASIAARRLYLYSKEDAIIRWEDIEAHAAEAFGRGYDVDLEMFEGTGHCEHMRKYPERYWDRIRRSWEEAVAGEANQMEG